MTRRILITLTIAALALAAADANAGDRRHGGWYQHHPPRAALHHPGWRGAHRRHHGRHYRGHVRRSHHRHHDDAWKWVAGAALLGTLAATLDRPRPAYRVAGPVRPAVRRPYSAQQRWYQRDSYGDCFEVRLLRDGQQLWTQVDPGRCY